MQYMANVASKHFATSTMNTLGLGFALVDVMFVCSPAHVSFSSRHEFHTPLVDTLPFISVNLCLSVFLQPC